MDLLWLGVAAQWIELIDNWKNENKEIRLEKLSQLKRVASRPEMHHLISFNTYFWVSNCIVSSWLGPAFILY